MCIAKSLRYTVLLQFLQITIHHQFCAFNLFAKVSRYWACSFTRSSCVIFVVDHTFRLYMHFTDIQVTDGVQVVIFIWQNVSHEYMPVFKMAQLHKYRPMICLCVHICESNL